MTLCDCGFSEPATPIPCQLSSPLNLPQYLGKAHQFLETEVAEALIRMKYLIPTSGDEVHLPGLSFLSPSASFSAIPEIRTPDNLSPSSATRLTADKSLPSSKAPRKRKPRVPRVDTVKSVLKRLHDAHISLMDLLFMILSGDDFGWYRLQFLSDSRRINDLLNLLWNNKKSRPFFGDWFKDHGIDHICNLIAREMEAAKPMLKMDLKDVSPEFLEHWDLNSIMDPVVSVTPTWSKVLQAATEPSKKKAEVGSDPRNRSTVCLCLIFLSLYSGTAIIFQTRNMIHASAHYLRSLASCKIQIGIGLTAWGTGASRRMIDILHQSALTMSYTSVLKVLESLSEHSLQTARDYVNNFPHALAYDNINISTSIFVEQRENMPSKVQSGTFPVIYELLNANPEHMQLEPMIVRFKMSSPLNMSDVRPRKEALWSFRL